MANLHSLRCSLPEPLVQQVGGCSCWADLKLLMRHLEAEGVLQQLPAKLAPGSELVLPPTAAEESAAEVAAAQAAGEGGAGQPAAAHADGPGPLLQAGAAGSGVPSDKSEEEEAPAAGEQIEASDPAAGKHVKHAAASSGAAGGEQADGPPSNPAAAAPAAAAAGTSAGLSAAQQGVAETAGQEEGEAAEMAGRAGASAAALTFTGVQATPQSNWQIQIYAPWDSCGRAVGELLAMVVVAWVGAMSPASPIYASLSTAPPTRAFDDHVAVLRERRIAVVVGMQILRCSDMHMLLQWHARNGTSK